MARSIIAAYIPLFTMERVERRLFSPMAFTVASALLGSLIFSLTLIPVLATWLFKHGARTWENPVIHWFAIKYEGMLGFSIHRAALVVTIALSLVAGSLLLARSLGAEFLPQLNEGVIWIRANLPPGMLKFPARRSISRSRSLTLQPRWRQGLRPISPSSSLALIYRDCAN